MTADIQTSNGNGFSVRLVCEVRREPLSGGHWCYVARHFDFPGAVVQEPTYLRAVARLRRMVRWLRQNGFPGSPTSGEGRDPR